MGAVYADVLDIVNAGEMNETARMGQDANAGETHITASGPVDMAPGALLVIGFRGQDGELAKIRSASGTAIELESGLSGDHSAGTRLLDATPFLDISEAASRMVDDLTWTPAGGWAYADLEKETKQTKVDRNGDLLMALNHTPVKEVQEVSLQALPLGDVHQVPAERVWWDDGSYIVHILTGWDVPTQPFAPVKVTVTYSGGYTADEMPADIRRATAMLAIRIWKEKDSGYSDIIGSNELGTFIYSKAAPPDVLAMLRPHKRVGIM